MKESILRYRISDNEPQQVAELINRTLVGLTHKMLSSTSMARKFPTDALSTRSYLMNGFSSTLIKCQTLQKVWLGNIVDYFVLVVYVFVYIRVSDVMLDERVRVRKYMFIGYVQGE